MTEFVMPTREELVEQLRAIKLETVAVFDRDGWTASARKLVARLDRLLAKYGG